MSTNHYAFKPGERVKVFNGGRLEGVAVIKKQHPGDSDYYVVTFEGDDETEQFKRWVMPEWQAPGFDPAASLDAAARLRYGNPRKALAVLLLTLALPFAAHAAEKAPRHVTRPVSTITVKVVTAADYLRKAKGADSTVTRDGRPAQWILTTLDADSCVAWVSVRAKNLPTAQLDAFIACQVAIGQAAGKDGAR